MQNLRRSNPISYAECPVDALWLTAAGPLTFPMTNDYMFRSLLQSNNNVLKGLICSLLHLEIDDVLSAEILNPIELGKTIDDKTGYPDWHPGLHAFPGISGILCNLSIIKCQKLYKI